MVPRAKKGMTTTTRRRRTADGGLQGQEDDPRGYGEEREKVPRSSVVQAAPFPRDAVRRRRADARDRAAAKEHRRGRAAAAYFDPFEDNLVRDSVHRGVESHWIHAGRAARAATPHRYDSRPPQQAAGPGPGLLRVRSGPISPTRRAPQVSSSSKWLSEGYPYGGLGTRERVAVLKALCDAYASSYGCATLVDEASELRALRDAKAEADERERKRNQAEKEKETASQVREKLALEMGCDVPVEMDEKKPRKKSKEASAVASGPAAARGRAAAFICVVGPPHQYRRSMLRGTEEPEIARVSSACLVRAVSKRYHDQGDAAAGRAARRYIQ